MYSVITRKPSKTHRDNILKNSATALNEELPCQRETGNPFAYVSLGFAVVWGHLLTAVFASFIAAGEREQDKEPQRFGISDTAGLDKARLATLTCVRITSSGFRIMRNVRKFPAIRYVFTAGNSASDVGIGIWQTVSITVDNVLILSLYPVLYTLSMNPGSGVNKRHRVVYCLLLCYLQVCFVPTSRLSTHHSIWWFQAEHVAA